MRQVFITKCDSFFLQNATVITNYDDFITKCDSFYKMRRLLQIATVHMPILSFYPWTELLYKFRFLILIIHMFF